MSRTIQLEPTKGSVAEQTGANSMVCTCSGVTYLSCTVRLLSSSHTLNMQGWNILDGSRIRTCNDSHTELIGFFPLTPGVKRRSWQTSDTLPALQLGLLHLETCNLLTQFFVTQIH